jgi:hypothetical protein
VKYRLVAVGTLGAASIVAAICLFLPESGSLLWHIRHGSSARLGNLEFQVPAFYWSEAYPEKNVLYINSVPGRARSYFKRGGSFKVALISIHKRPGGGNALAIDEREDPWAAHVYKKTMDSRLTLADDPGRCVAYQGPADWTGENDEQVFCEFNGGMHVHFDGTAPGLNDFYKILETAVNRENR